MRLSHSLAVVLLGPFALWPLAAADAPSPKGRQELFDLSAQRKNGRHPAAAESPLTDKPFADTLIGAPTLFAIDSRVLPGGFPMSEHSADDRDLITRYKAGSQSAAGYPCLPPSETSRPAWRSTY